MDLIRALGALAGAGLAALGLLWLLQGTGAVRVRPVLCVADCEPVEGRSPFWAVAGGVASAIGVLLARAALRRGTG